MDVAVWPNGSPRVGPCCVCRVDNETVRNLIMLPRRAPVRGTGWGCFICELENDGALAILCDACAEKANEVEFLDVCYGYPLEGKRTAYTDLDPEPFEHDKMKHEEFEKEVG